MITRGRRLPFVIAPWWVLDLGLEPVDVLVYLTIARHADRDGHAHPSRARIAKLAGVSVSTVDRSVARLVDAGAIDKRSRRDDAGDPTSNLYVVHEAPPGYVDPDAEEVAAPMTPPPVAGDPTVAAQVTPQVAAPMTHELETPELEPRTSADGWAPMPSVVRDRLVELGISREPTKVAG